MDNVCDNNDPELELARSQQSENSERTTPEDQRGSRREAPSLRPHTLMIDLLFGALMLFALHMGNPNSQQIVAKAFDLPSTSENAEQEHHELVALAPIRGKEGNWRYETPEGNRLSAAEVRAWVNKKGTTPVLVVSRSLSVQDYIDAEEPLRKEGITVGLAVELESEANQ
jgi:hypothetical protein